MTVDGTNNRKDYDPDGIVTTFIYSFRVDNAEDMKVYADGDAYLEPFSITGLGDPLGGDVIFDIAPSADIDVLTLIREVPLTQQTAYPPLGPFPAPSHEQALDKLTFAIQQHQEVLGRAGVAPIDANPLTDFTLPKYVAGEYWRWDPLLRKIVTSVISVTISSEGIPIAENIESLRTITPSALTPYADVAGYWDKGDGGGGQRRVGVYGAPIGTYVDNGGSIIVPGDGSAAWIVPSSAVMSILEWGGSPDAVDNLTQVQSWKDSVPSGTLIFPDLGGSVYTLSSAPTGDGTGYVYRMEGSARFGAVVPLGTIEYDYNQQGTETTYKLLRIEGDTVDQPSIAGSKVNGNKTLHEFGGSATKGGRHAGYNVLVQTEETASDNPDRFYVSTVGQTIGSSSTGDGGTVGSEKGSLFACNFITNAYSNYTNATAISGGEINTKIEAGATTLRHTLLQLVTDDEVQGSYLDAGLAIGSKSGAIGLRYGVFIGYGNGGNPMDTTEGILIGASGDAGALNCKTGIDVSGYRFTDAVLNSHYAKITAFGTIVAGATDGTTPSPSYQFRSSGLSTRDATIVCTGGTATTNDGSLTLQAAAIIVSNTFRPNADNIINLGVASFRWSEVFAANGVINTSDENEKCLIEDIPDSWIQAARNIKPKRFKFKDAVAKKGDSARWHTGYIAQQVFQALSDAGVSDPWECSFLCKDLIEEQGEDGELIPLIDEQTGLQKERWGLRYSELLVLKDAARNS